jgi:diacylglycerol kinase family enzyme
MVRVSHAQGEDTLTVVEPTVSLRRRLLAAVSLVLMPVAMVMALYGFIHGFPELIAALVVVLAVAFCLWQGLGRRRVGRIVWLVLAALLLVLTVVLLWLSGRQVLWIAVAFVVAVIAGSAAGSALLHLPRRAGTRPSRSHAVLRRPVLFVNPKSGDGTAEQVGLVDAARERGIDAVALSKGDDLKELARAAVRDGADVLGAAGGDGTLAQVAEVAIEAGLPFVCIPAGTRNHFALDLGLDRTDPLGALDAFTEAFDRRIDVAEVNGSMFLNNVSIGAYGEVVADEQYRERKIGTALSKLPELIGPEAEGLDLQFTDGDGSKHDSAIVVHVSNNAYELTPRPGFGTRPSLSDGLLGIVAVVEGSLAAPVRVLRWESPTFDLTSGAGVPAGLDGEAVELTSPVQFRIRPGVLLVRIPTHAMGVSPSGFRPGLSWATVKRLGSVAAGRLPAA